MATWFLLLKQRSDEAHLAAKKYETTMPISGRHELFDLRVPCLESENNRYC